MRKLAIVLVLLLVLALAIGATGCPTPTLTPTPSPTLQVHYINVGQGDSILLDLDEVEVLIDGGDRSPGVVAYLRDYVDGTLEAMIATHPHADHIGGLIAVLDSFEVEQIWLNGDTHTTQTYSDFVDKVNAEGADVREARRGDTIQVGDLTFKVLYPTATLVDDINNNSIVLKLSYGDVDFLFTGDAEHEAESSMLGAGVLADIDILKVGHHASRTSSSQLFLDTVRPEVAVYMAGTDNKYGHPHEETISALCNAGVTVYGTDVHGIIIVTTDGTTPSVQPLNDKPPICDGRDGPDWELNIGANGQGTTNPSQGTHPYDDGERVEVSAFPASGWEFDHWGGDASGTSTQTTVVMDSNKSVTAYFTTIQYTLTTSVSPSGSGSVSPPGGTFDAETVVNLTATANPDYEFSHWSGTDNNSINPTTVTMDSNKSVTAYFIQKPSLPLELSVTTPIGQGYTATLEAKTEPGAYCTITVYYKSGPSGASGLDDKYADSLGNVSWSWKVGTRTTPGDWQIVVTASLGERIAEESIYFKVI